MSLARLTSIDEPSQPLNAHLELSSSLLDIFTIEIYSETDQCFAETCRFQPHKAPGSVTDVGRGLKEKARRATWPVLGRDAAASSLGKAGPMKSPLPRGCHC